MAITHISFDLDGTLITLAGMEFKLWFDVIPTLYSKKHNISFNEAYTKCKQDYKEFDDSNIVYYDPPFWFKKFGLEQDSREIISKLSSSSSLVYPDVIQTLENLQQKYKLVLFTNTDRTGLEIKMKCTGLGKYFPIQVSAVSDLGVVKTEPQAYEKLVQHLGIQKENIVHVGDYVHHDYEPARSAGVKSVLIDRDGAFQEDYDKILTLGDIEKFLN